MSLDVTLTVETPCERSGTGVFVRDNGRRVELTADEVLARFGQAVDTRTTVTNDVFEYNVTHNLGRMAAEANIYCCIWRPDECGITTAAQLIPSLAAGLSKLLAEPERFKAFNAPNGWGDYDGFVTFVQKYLAACIENPTATVSVSR